LGEEVLGRYRAEFKDDYVLFLLSFNTYRELAEFVGRLSFIHGSIEEATTDPSITVMVIRFTDREFCLIIGGQLEKAVCRELIARCQKDQVSYSISAANESSWYAHELRRTLIDLKTS